MDYAFLQPFLDTINNIITQDYSPSSLGSETFFLFIFILSIPLLAAICCIVVLTLSLKTRRVFIQYIIQGDYLSASSVRYFGDYTVQIPGYDKLVPETYLLAMEVGNYTTARKSLDRILLASDTKPKTKTALQNAVSYLDLIETRETLQLPDPVDEIKRKELLPEHEDFWNAVHELKKRTPEEVNIAIIQPIRTVSLRLILQLPLIILITLATAILIAWLKMGEK